MNFKQFLKTSSSYKKFREQSFSGDFLNEISGEDSKGKFYLLPTSINNIRDKNKRDDAIKEVLDCINDFLNEFKLNSQKFVINLNSGNNRYLLNLMKYNSDIVKTTLKNMSVDASNFVDNKIQSTGGDLRQEIISKYLSSLKVSDFFRDTGDDANTSWAYEFRIDHFFNRFNIQPQDLDSNFLSHLKPKFVDAAVYIKFNFVAFERRDGNIIPVAVNRSTDPNHLKKVFFYFKTKVLNDISFHISDE